MTERIVVDSRFSDEPAKVVWKFNVPLQAGPVLIQIPVAARLLHVEFVESGFLTHDFFLWYEIELALSDQTMSHVYQAWSTGDNTIPHVAKHIGTGMTWQQDHRHRYISPDRVWHLYEFPSGAKVVDA